LGVSKLKDGKNQVDEYSKAKKKIYFYICWVAEISEWNELERAVKKEYDDQHQILTERTINKNLNHSNLKVSPEDSRVPNQRKGKPLIEEM
jgi:hypothetical protein